MSNLSLRSKYGSVKVTGTDTTVANGLIIKILEDTVFNSISEEGITDPLAFHGISGSQGAGEEIYAATKFTDIKLVSGAVRIGGRIIKGTGFSFGAEYQIVYDYLITKPSDVIAINQNTMFGGMVDAGLVAKLDTFYVYAQTTNGAAEALPNWINPGTNDCTLQGTPAFVALEGFTASTVAGSHLILTNWNPTVHGSNYTVNSASFGVYIRTNSGGNMCDIGIDDGSNDMWIYSLNAGSTTTRINDAGTDFNANTDSRGFFIASRIASNARAMYRNAALLGSDAQAATALSNRILTIGARMALAPSAITNRQYSIGFTGGGLTGPDVTTFTNLVHAYMESNDKGWGA